MGIILLAFICAPRARHFLMIAEVCEYISPAIDMARTVCSGWPGHGTDSWTGGVMTQHGTEHIDTKDNTRHDTQSLEHDTKPGTKSGTRIMIPQLTKHGTE